MNDPLRKILQVSGSYFDETSQLEWFFSENLLGLFIIHQTIIENQFLTTQTYFVDLKNYLGAILLFVCIKDRSIGAKNAYLELSGVSINYNKPPLPCPRDFCMTPFFKNLGSKGIFWLVLHKFWFMYSILLYSFFQFLRICHLATNVISWLNFEVLQRKAIYSHL